MLICSFWTNSIQKLPPSQRKRLKCNRFPLGFVSWQQENWQSRVVGVGHCHLSGQTSAFIWRTQDAFTREAMGHFSKVTEACSLKLEAVCHSSLPGLLGSTVSRGTRFGEDLNSI